VRVSVIVVSYNTRDLLRRCLSGLADQHQVIVVDNASSDASADLVAEEFPAALLIRNDVNCGFGAANNQGLAAMTGDVALLLNSDAAPLEGAIDRLVECMRDASVVACGGRLAHPGGAVQNSCANALTLWAVFCEQSLLEKLFPKSRLFSPYWLTPRLVDAPEWVFDVEQVMGACLMMRPVERFDEDFFLYCEDTELCRRLRKHGRILWVKDAGFDHELGASSSQGRWMSVARYNRGKELYFRKHHGKAAMALCWILNRKGAAFRLMIWGIPTLLTLGLIGRLRRQAGLFIRVLFVPLRGPASPTGRY
jgi:GT2 family glycosyltransferase